MGERRKAKEENKKRYMSCKNPLVRSHVFFSSKGTGRETGSNLNEADRVQSLEPRPKPPDVILDVTGPASWVHGGFQRRVHLAQSVAGSDYGRLSQHTTQATSPLVSLGLLFLSLGIPNRPRSGVMRIVDAQYGWNRRVGNSLITVR